MFYLKPYLFSFIFFITFNAVAQDVNCSCLKNIDGKYYTSKNNKLFTGNCLMYHNNGNISSRISYKCGIFSGLCQWYHPNGQIKKEVFYFNYSGNSYLHGNSYEWYSNGQLKIEETYKKGLRDGKWFEYDSTGKIIKQRIYSEGLIIWGDGKLTRPQPR